MLLWHISFVIFFAASLSTSAQFFSKITIGPPVSDGGSSHGAAWGDYDADGFLDLFVCHHDRDRGNLLCRNNGNGTFTKITNAITATESGNTYSGVWGDYDNDGHLDLFLAKFTTNALYRNNGDLSFSRVSAGNFFSIDTGLANAASWGDYDNDGFIDLYVAFFQGRTNLLYRNDGSGGFVLMTNAAPSRDRADSLGSAWADFDNDGDQDLYVSNGFTTSQTNFLYLNNGEGTFTRITNGAPVTDLGKSFGCVWGDYDNDGWLDLFVSNSGQTNFLYHNNGDGSFTRNMGGSIATDVAVFYHAVWGDIDNDGFLDLFVANFGGNNFLYRNNGDGSFGKELSDITVNDGGISAGCVLGDYDNDGFLDLYVTNHGGNNYMYHNNGNTNSWLAVKLIGTASNRSAIGAKVRVQATYAGAQHWQMREITTGDSINGGSLVANFGFRDAAVADVVRTEWPSGIVQELRNVSLRQAITVTEPPVQTRIARAGVASVQLSVISRKGSRVRLDATADLANWPDGATYTNVTGALTLQEQATSPCRYFRAIKLE